MAVPQDRAQLGLQGVALVDPVGLDQDRPDRVVQVEQALAGAELTFLIGPAATFSAPVFTTSAPDEPATEAGREVTP